MPTTSFDKDSIKASIIGKLQRYNGRTIEEASNGQIYRALASTVRDQIMQKWMISREERKTNNNKRLFYLSVEFLMGRSLYTNILNLVSLDAYKQALDELHIDVDKVLQEEPEPALGNGGLGRLAACFMDSLASLDLPAMGCSIRYEYGLFRQKIVDGQQVELPDYWLGNGNVWEMPVMEDACEVHFNGHVEMGNENGRTVFRHVGYNTVEAVPYDMPLVGYDTSTVNSLRLWSARAPKRIDLSDFNHGHYVQASEEKELAEAISNILYPEDNHYEGKLLRLKQQYFFTSATLQYILKDFKKLNGTNWSKLPEKVVIHINDTHPGLAIPELMRLLMDEESLGWDEAQQIVSRTMAYTNHTIMAEALEKWPMDYLLDVVPHLVPIIEKLDEKIKAKYPQENVAIIDKNNLVHMAHMDIHYGFSINGVAALHTEILKTSELKAFYDIYPEKFNNKTNGITFRRWLMHCNHPLTDYITSLIGDEFKTNATALENLLKYKDDEAVLNKLLEIKTEAKKTCKEFILSNTGVEINENSIYDIQIKRLHEYKRQQLNALYIISKYLEIKGGKKPSQPVTFIFGAKAAPAYVIAKDIIHLILCLQELINQDPEVSPYLNVIMVENYNVTLAEKLIPACDISEQISLASKEASGTGNMKFMLNGAPTLGTMDGANVEIVEEVGAENAFIFGLSSDEVINYENNGGYDPNVIYNTDEEIRQVLMQLINGTFSNDTELFRDLYDSLLNTKNTDRADRYFILADFRSYADAQKRVEEAYRDEKGWAKKALLNTACSGKFTSDRTIEEYVRDIWHLEKVEVPSGQDLFE